MTTYNYLQLNPNAPVQPSFDFGVEVTIPVPSHITNLDHHRPGDTQETPAACQQALAAPLPTLGSTIAFVRLDPDTALTLAVLTSRAEGRRVSESLVEAIGLMDRFGPASSAKMKNEDLGLAVARYSCDYNIPLEQRIEWLQNVMEGKIDWNQVQQLNAARAAELAEAKANSKIRVIIPGLLVFVESENRFATNLGYALAPTVISFNPKMPVIVDRKPTGETYVKYTVSRWDSNVPTNLDAITAELQQLELQLNDPMAEDGKPAPEWGGLANVKGSPQNVDSKLSVEQVIDIVSKYVS